MWWRGWLLHLSLRPVGEAASPAAPVGKECLLGFPSHLGGGLSAATSPSPAVCVPRKPQGALQHGSLIWEGESGPLAEWPCACSVPHHQPHRCDCEGLHFFLRPLPEPCPAICSFRRGLARSCAGQESPVALSEAVLHSMGAQGHFKTLPAAPPAAAISGPSLAGLPHNQWKVGIRGAGVG